MQRRWKVNSECCDILGPSTFEPKLADRKEDISGGQKSRVQRQEEEAYLGKGPVFWHVACAGKAGEADW